MTKHLDHTKYEILQQEKYGYLGRGENLVFFEIYRRGFQLAGSVALFKHFTHYGLWSCKLLSVL